MGLFDFLKKPKATKIEKAAKRMLNEHHQVQVRQESMDELVSNGSPEAILALVSRLGVNFRDTIKNEQEKRWITDTLVNHFGQQAVGPLSQFIRDDQTISAVIICLSRLIEHEKLIELLIEVLKGYVPEDHRSIDAKLQLVDALADDESDDRVVPAVLPYAMDHDDQVRVKVIDILQDRVAAGHEEYDTTVGVLIEVLEDAEASGRITRRAADALIALQADLSSKADSLADFMPDGYRIEDGVLRKD